VLDAISESIATDKLIKSARSKALSTSQKTTKIDEGMKRFMKSRIKKCQENSAQLCTNIKNINGQIRVLNSKPQLENKSNIDALKNEYTKASATQALYNKQVAEWEAVINSGLYIRRANNQKMTK
jgi:hypothetical protein